MTRLANKKALITGGSSGIGRAIALAYAKEGADVAITYNSSLKEANEVIDEINKFAETKAIAIKADITQSHERVRLIQSAVDYLGEINILVNCAGIYPSGEFLEATEEMLDMVMELNFKAPYFLTQIVSQQMKKQGKGGSIINISSSRDNGGMPNISLYACSKSALSTFSRCSALELAHYNIRINTIAPGLIQTDMHRSAWEGNPELWAKKVNEIPIRRAGLTEDVSALAIYLGCDESGYVTGSRFLVDGGRSLGTTPAK